jgi:hypothetical protein
MPNNQIIDSQLGAYLQYYYFSLYIVKARIVSLYKRKNLEFLKIIALADA